MPFVSVKSIEGTLSPEQKAEMIARVTDAVVAVEGEFVRDYTWVIVEEIKGSDWGFGGHPVTAEAIAAAKSADA
jgi:4-oxalocrotonate tautomerase